MLQLKGNQFDRVFFDSEVCLVLQNKGNCIDFFVGGRFFGVVKKGLLAARWRSLGLFGASWRSPLLSVAPSSPWCSLLHGLIEQLD